MVVAPPPVLLLGTQDVLLGRGTGPNEQMGNVRFRALVRESIQVAGGPRFVTGRTKHKLAMDVMAQVKANGGRFLRKMKPSSNTTTRHQGEQAAGPEGEVQQQRINTTAEVATITTDGYEEVTDEQALDKVKQSFRHQVRQCHGKPLLVRRAQDVVLAPNTYHERSSSTPTLAAAPPLFSASSSSLLSDGIINTLRSSGESCGARRDIIAARNKVLLMQQERIAGMNEILLAEHFAWRENILRSIVLLYNQEEDQGRARRILPAFFSRPSVCTSGASTTILLSSSSSTSSACAAPAGGGTPIQATERTSILDEILLRGGSSSFLCAGLDPRY